MPKVKGKYGHRFGAGRMGFYDERGGHEAVLNIGPVTIYDDFLGADLVIPASAESGVYWRKSIVGAAPPTVAKVANAANGAVQCAMTSASQAQSAFLYAGDQKCLDSAFGLIFEARIKLTVLPTLVGEIVIGLAGNTGVPDSINYSAWFTADGSGELFCEADNNSSDTSATSGTTLDNATWVVLRIDCADEDNVFFYLNGNRVASSTTFKVQGPLQPFIGCYKASGAGLGNIQIDYVRILQNRS